MRRSALAIAEWSVCLAAFTQAPPGQGCNPYRPPTRADVGLPPNLSRPTQALILPIFEFNRQTPNTAVNPKNRQPHPPDAMTKLNNGASLIPLATSRFWESWKLPSADCGEGMGGLHGVEMGNCDWGQNRNVVPGVD